MVAVIIKTEQGPEGLLGTEASLCPQFMFSGNGPHSASATCPEFPGQVQTVAYQGRKGMQRPGRNSQGTTVQPRAGLWFPVKGYTL